MSGGEPPAFRASAAPPLLRVPVQQAQRTLRQTVRLVADLPRGSSPDVVWRDGANELLVHTGGISIACRPGLVAFGLPVTCDQLGKHATVQVPLGVGTPDAPAGLVMSSLARPVGPDVVVDVWSQALVAFVWEALVHLAQILCAQAGVDPAKRPLVPGAVAATRDLLLIQPVVRHQVRRRQP